MKIPIWKTNSEKSVSKKLGWILALFLFLSILTLIGCSSGFWEDGRYYHKTGQFSIAFPGAWKLVKNERSAVFFRNAEGTAVIIVLFMDFTSPVSLDNFINELLSLEKSKEGLWASAEKKQTEIGGSKAYRLITKERTSPDGETISYARYIMAKDNRVYELKIIAQADYFGVHESELEEIIRSFRFEI